MILEIVKWITIVLSIVCIIISFLCYKDGKDMAGSEHFGIGWLIFSIIIFPIGIYMLSWLIGLGVGSVIATEANKVEVYKYTTSIYCLNDDSKIEGRTYLYGGYVNQNMVYRTMYIDEHGGKKMWEINVNKASVFEDGKKEVVVFGEKYENPKVDYWLKGFDDSSMKNDTRYEIHVPKGSVVSEFNIDLK